MKLSRRSPAQHSPRGFGGAIKAAAIVAGFAVFTIASMSTAQAVEVDVLRSSPESILVEYRVSDFFLEPVSIDDTEFSLVVVGDEAPLTTRGAPELPSITRSFIIPDEAHMSPSLVYAEYEDFQGVSIAPSKGIISRQVDPSSVPYEFGSVYDQDSFFPSSVIEVGSPYIMRDVRGAVVNIHPFRYNPVQNVLRVYHRIVVELVPDGPGQVNVRDSNNLRPSIAFSKVYKHRFANSDNPPWPELYPPVTETGDMLVICHDEWLPNIGPLVSHKNSIGIPTTVVGVSTVGNNSSSIAAHIQSAYDAGNLAFVLLVGDSTHVATPTSSGGSSDPSYAKVDGSDNYPDIFVGRFSAQTSNDVDTQVDRTITYENTPATVQTWFKKGVGIGSDEGPGDDGEMDSEHIDNIRTDLLSYGYTEVDQTYDPGASASDVSTALNAGRGIINYCGHGSNTSWVTTGFDTSDINGLTNDNMLPFIFDVACVNGNFASGTCFAEAWMRATNGSNPTGAIAIYASSINQSWNPPMAAQDESNDLLVAEAHFSFGALAYAGSCLMMDEYSSGGVEMYDTWHVFGDPSLRVFGSSGPVSGISVTPYSDATFAGDAGGPFTPDSTSYTITNYGDDSVNWEVVVMESWIESDSSSGTLAAGATADVTISLSSIAATMSAGDYQGDVEFADLTNSTGTMRTVTLEIEEVECEDADDDGFLPLYCDGEDCDDGDKLVNPDADEVCDDNVDNNCDELVDDEDPDCEETGSDTDTDSDSDTDTTTTTNFSPGDSGCGCDVTGTPNTSLLGTILSAIF